MFDIVLIAPAQDPLRKRVQDICADFSYSLCMLENTDQYMENEMAVKCEFVICSSAEVSVKSEVAGLTQVIRQFSNDAFIVMIISGKMAPEDAQFVKKSGASLILLHLDAVTTAKLDLIASQKIKFKYLPIKVHELAVDGNVACDVFHLMPLNNKYLKIFKKGSPVSKDKLEKLATYREVYVQKEDVDDFVKDLESRSKGAGGAEARCRTQLLQLSVAYINLILMVVDQSEYTSYSLGKVLFERVSKMSSELLISLGSVLEPWNVINNSAIGDFGSIERGPSISAYAGLMSLNSDIGTPAEVMISCLLMDVGLLDIDPKIIRKIRNNQEDQFTPEELSDYQKHPTTAIHRILGRKLPVSEKIKQTILCSHERADGQGFPSRIKKEAIPEEAFIVKMAAMLDRMSLIKMGAERPKIEDVRTQIITTEFESRREFSLDFLQKIGPYLTGKLK